MARVLYDHKWMTLWEDKNGEAFVEMDGDEVMIAALTDRNEIILIREKSIAYGRETLALPTGGVERGEFPEETVNRELQEEVGYAARDIQHVGTLNPAVKYMKWQCHVYLARNLHRSWRKGDETSAVQPIMIPLNAVDNLIDSGILSDASTVAALSMVKRYLRNESRMLANVELMVVNR